MKRRNILWLLVYLGAFCALSLQPHAARAQHISEQRGIKIYGPAPKSAEAEPKPAAKAEASVVKKPLAEDDEDQIQDAAPIDNGDGYGIYTLSGAPVKLTDLLRKGRPYVINFWATWCGPCRQELPHLMQLADAYKSTGLQVIGLNLEDPRTEDRRVRAFLQQARPNFPMLYGSHAACRALNNNQPCNSIPRTFIIAANGSITARLSGYQPEPLGIAVGQAARSVNSMPRGGGSGRR